MRSPIFFALTAVCFVACCLNARAETFPIIDVRQGYLIGAVENGKWVEPTDATKSVKRGAKLPVYGASGQTGTVAIVKLDTEAEACPDQPMVKLNPKKMKDGEIAFAAKWNPLPRKPKSLDVKDKKYVDPTSGPSRTGDEATAGRLVGEFLRERGLKDPVVHITQAV